MGTTRTNLVTSSVAIGAIPARTPGTLGVKDGAEPSRLLCMPGDTPGAVGVGGDTAAQLSSAGGLRQHNRASWPMTEYGDEIEIHLIEEKRIVGWMRRAAYVRAALQFASEDIQRHAKDDSTRVDSERDRLMAVFQLEWDQAKRTDADAVWSFCEQVRQSADEDFARLMRLYGAEGKAAQEIAARWGTAGRIVSTVHLTATVFRKLLSTIPNPIGWGIDVATDMAEAGIGAYTAADRDPGAAAAAAEIQTLAKELAKKGVEDADELADILAGLSGLNLVEAEAAQIERRVATLQRKLTRRLAKYAANRAVVRDLEVLLTKTKSILIRRKAVLLPLKGMRLFARKGLGAAAGHMFIALDVAEAFTEWEKNMRAFSD